MVKSPQSCEVVARVRALLRSEAKRYWEENPLVVGREGKEK